MRNLIYLIIRYSALFLFLVLEFFAFYLIVNYNRSQKEIWAHSSNLLTGNLYKKIEHIEDYFDLRIQNDSLQNENSKLLEKIINYRVLSRDNAFQKFESTDTLNNYHLLPATICNKTLNLRNNYFTLCKGREDGIEVGMGVISDYGIVGIVNSVSSHFATVLLIINSRSNISVKVKNKNYPGSLVWNNSNPDILNLINIPKHASIEVGDSVVTSGYSISFPPEIFVGKINDFSIESGSNNYRIDINLDYQLSRLEFVYVVKYDLIEEKQTLIQMENE